MPNYCSNRVTFRHNDKAQITKLVDAYRNGATMQAFVPMPEELESTDGIRDTPNWRDWRCENWGTKWDFGMGNHSEATEPVISEDGKECFVQFDTPWNAPCQFYDALNEMGFAVAGSWFEPCDGDGGVGTFDIENDYAEAYDQDEQEWSDLAIQHMGQDWLDDWNECLADGRLEDCA